MPRIIATSAASAIRAAAEFAKRASSNADAGEATRRSLLATAMFVTVAVHAAICVVIAAAYADMAFRAPWYLTVIATVLGIRSYFGGCPLTSIENYLRRSAGMPEVDTFLAHYLCRKC